MTPNDTRKILEALKKGEKLKTGPMSGRQNCEPKGGLTSLTETPKGPGFDVRSDL